MAFEVRRRTSTGSVAPRGEDRSPSNGVRRRAKCIERGARLAADFSGELSGAAQGSDSR